MKPRWIMLTLALLWLPGTRGQDNAGPAPAFPPLEHFEGILERPLFEESRRPAIDESQDDVSASASAMREKWRLSGVVWEGDQQLALFSERQGERRARIKVGMYLDGGWQLEEIGVDAVTLGDGADRLRLELWEPRLPPNRPLVEGSATPAEPPAQEEDNREAAPAGSGEDQAAPDNHEQGSNGESS